jgi:hypothetical protein
MIEDDRIAKKHIDINQKPFDPYTQCYGHEPYNTGHKIVSEKLGKTVVIPRQ